MSGLVHPSCCSVHPTPNLAMSKNQGAYRSLINSLHYSMVAHRRNWQDKKFYATPLAMLVVQKICNEFSGIYSASCSLVAMCRLSRVIMPLVSGNRSQRTAVVAWGGTRPRGTVLCNQRWVRTGVLSATASAAVKIRSFSTVGLTPRTNSIGWTGGKDNLLWKEGNPDCFDPFPSPSPRAKTSRTVIDWWWSAPLLASGVAREDDGNDSTERGEAARELGARSVRYISCEVRFVAWTFTTWHW